MGECKNLIQKDQEPNNEKEFELENPETYGKDLSDYIDKLNNNIELIKKAFNQTSLELEKPPVLNMEESEIHGDEILQEKEEFTRKKEKSLLVTPADFGNEAQRKFNSFNSMYRVNLEHVENALENSTFSLSLLNKRLREYPEKIRFLEEQIQKIYKDRDVANEKIEVLMKNESDLMKNLNEFNEKVQILEGKNKALESEIEQKEVIIKTHANTIENFEKKEKNVHDIHYKIENSLNNSSEKPNAKDAKIEIMDRKNCCKIF